MRKLVEIICGKEPLVLPPTATVREACCYMRDHHAGAVMVVNGKQHLVGVLSA